MKRAIVYYSLSGNTKEAAEKLAALLQAELIRVETARPMPDSFKSQILKGGFQAAFGIKPRITGLAVRPEEYDELILGTPIWAGLCAAPMNTVLAAKGIAEKVTAVFTLSGGGDNDKCLEALRKKLPNLKHTAALADRKYGKAEENEEKIIAFAEEIRNGERP